jgi:hypothetical protein
VTETLRRIAARVREFADLLAAADLGEHAIQADALADEIDRLASGGVPEHIDPDETTPQAIDLAEKG